MPRREAVALVMAAAMLTLAADNGGARNVPSMVPVQADAASMPRRLFISGHSLTARPFPDHLAAIGGAAGRPVEWEMQHLYGSSLKQRADEALVDGASYDAVILAERPTLLESLIWDDTVAHLASVSGRARAANPAAATYLFASWIDYHRMAGASWRCTARAADGAIRGIPAGEAMALLVERALAGQVAGMAGVTPLATLRTIFTDEVHLTPAGTYFTALVTHGVLHGSLPDYAPVVTGVPAATAASLREAAAAFLAQPAVMPADAEACRAYMADTYAPGYLDYIRDVRWRRDDGWARAQYKWLRFRLTWPARLRRGLLG